MALQLRKIGIRRVRPLLGGFHEWKSLGFPLVEIGPAEIDSGISTPFPPKAARKFLHWFFGSGWSSGARLHRSLTNLFCARFVTGHDSVCVRTEFTKSWWNVVLVEYPTAPRARNRKAASALVSGKNFESRGRQVRAQSCRSAFFYVCHHERTLVREGSALAAGRAILLVPGSPLEGNQVIYGFRFRISRSKLTTPFSSRSPCRVYSLLMLYSN